MVETSRTRGARRDRDARLPSTGAGLIRYFDEDTRGIKLSPYTVVVLAVVIAVIVIMANWQLSTPTVIAP
ncbi:MAG: preprotein translocase subunit Sec61beta [Methanobacteriota archaeon]|nr:MAG: preprotein translocase subunit Sec61beta [Euryarchaeota archaeon]